MTAWLEFHTNSDDDDLENDLDSDFGTLIPRRTKTATTQIADDAGLTPAEILEIRRQEKVDDKQVRKLVTDDSYYDLQKTDRHLPGKEKFSPEILDRPFR